MRIKKGIVTSNKMDKTVIVFVVTYKIHSKYNKRFKITKKFYAHDENNICNKGDIVTIKEVNPLSKNKRWIVVTWK